MSSSNREKFVCPSGLSFIGIYISIIIILTFLFTYVINPFFSQSTADYIANVSVPAISLLMALMALFFIDSVTTNYWCIKGSTL